MKQTNPQILVFKTDITELCSNCEVAKKLNTHPLINEWSIDTEDKDNILRIVTTNIVPQQIIQLVTESGHYCSEL
ncbi:hypothetical protein [Flavobacterium beibuense]|uniref:HMA domain-containing protein n=1 Tax=Flavobacterium beibuense F44-8 TaxID=1406840 RepID=A0A0A2LYA8_9FLAO|nr:hypothetical protein [Flavobacterium beibuense]KGO84168.1 hypothetical protein Q763_00030 [Flavobacterium beibuense F44-8]